ncbi:MAG: tRNA pseudouridine(55) synthase TruB [Chloroflexi bacterium]|nr:tRNA pseudouridine(55) synthase TruB [Chloroflexota bacterium]
MDGIFNVNKPKGMTSHDVVNVVRRASSIRRVGHAGALDPAAEGVLLICVGKATRVVEYLMESRKTYCAEVTLGIETDTYDSEGRIVFTAPASQLNKIALDDVKDALSTMTGTIEQVPPRFSAIKRQGQPLYKLARAGIQVELQSRTVEIYRAEVLNWQPPVVRIEIECSKGTYIRSFAHDLGQQLKCGAYLSRLVRLASGRFSINDALPVSIVEDIIRRGCWESVIYPLDRALLDFGAAILGEESQRAIVSGQTWAPRERELTDEMAARIHGLCRAYSLEGEIVGLLKLDRQTRRWQPEKVFV